MSENTAGSWDLNIFLSLASARYLLHFVPFERYVRKPDGCIYDRAKLLHVLRNNRGFLAKASGVVKGNRAQSEVAFIDKLPKTRRLCSFKSYSQVFFGQTKRWDHGLWLNVTIPSFQMRL